MRSFKIHLNKEALEGLITPIGFVVFSAILILFAQYVVPFLQELPLYRMDRYDASWFAVCTFVYSPILIPVLIVAVGLMIAVCFGIWHTSILLYKLPVLFYRHVILKPGRTIVIIFTGLVLLWVGSLAYPVALELIEYLS